VSATRGAPHRRQDRSRGHLSCCTRTPTPVHEEALAEALAGAVASISCSAEVNREYRGVRAHEHDGRQRVPGAARPARISTCWTDVSAR
jgi:hypothetical protein